MGFLFEDLKVYQKALSVAKEIVEICQGIKRGNSTIVDQLQRAALSIPTNIAEGNGRWHKKDRANFFTIAKGSAFECIPLLEICKGLNLIEAEKVGRFREELDAIGKMLTMLIKGMEKRVSD